MKDDETLPPLGRTLAPLADKPAELAARLNAVFDALPEKERPEFDADDAEALVQWGNTYPTTLPAVRAGVYADEWQRIDKELDVPALRVALKITQMEAMRDCFGVMGLLALAAAVFVVGVFSFTALGPAYEGYKEARRQWAACAANQTELLANASGLASCLTDKRIYVNQLVEERAKHDFTKSELEECRAQPKLVFPESHEAIRIIFRMFEEYVLFMLLLMEELCLFVIRLIESVIVY